MSRWDLSHASSYSCKFLLAATERVRAHRSMPSLEKSVFGYGAANDTWIALYRVAEYYALSNYRHGRGISSRDGLTKSTRVDLLYLARACVQLLRKNGPYVFIHASQIVLAEILKRILVYSAYRQRMRRSQRSISRNRSTSIAIARTQCTRIFRTTLPLLTYWSLTLPVSQSYQSGEWPLRTRIYSLIRKCDVFEAIQD